MTKSTVSTSVPPSSGCLAPKSGLMNITATSTLTAAPKWNTAGVSARLSRGWCAVLIASWNNKCQILSYTWAYCNIVLFPSNDLFLHTNKIVGCFLFLLIPFTHLHRWFWISTTCRFLLRAYYMFNPYEHSITAHAKMRGNFFHWAPVFFCCIHIWSPVTILFYMGYRF